MPAAQGSALWAWGTEANCSMGDTGCPVSCPQAAAFHLTQGGAQGTSHLFFPLPSFCP